VTSPPAASPSQPALAECNCLALRQASRHVTQFYDQCLAPTGLRTTQFSILARLRRRGPLAINVLAAELVMDRTTLGRNILPLERDGLITIERDDADRRQRALHLTDAGAERLRSASPRWADAQTRFEAAFGSARAAELRGLLGAVVVSTLDPASAGTPVEDQAAVGRHAGTPVDDQGGLGRHAGTPLDVQGGLGRHVEMADGVDGDG